MPLEYAPQTRSIYSDLGFILLGILATLRGRRMLAEQFADIVHRLVRVEPALSEAPLTFSLPAAWSGIDVDFARPDGPGVLVAGDPSGWSDTIALGIV